MYKETILFSIFNQTIFIFLALKNYLKSKNYGNFLKCHDLKPLVARYNQKVFCHIYFKQLKESGKFNYETPKNT
jgi:hypothetical protein